MVVVVAAAVVLAGLTAIGTASLGTAMVQRSRAQLAADAAALAALDGGRGAAARLAAANGGRVVRYTEVGAVVTVEVRVGRAQATARASDGP